jgi:rubrerythrin
MTEKEALEVLHGLRPRGSIIPQKRAEMIDIADEAISKQIPQKPSVVLGIYGSSEYGCENCGDTIPDNMYDFCPWCGQAIDWSDECDA